MAFIVNRMTLHIEWGHCDPAGIVFNPRVFEFFDAGTWYLFEAALGIPKQKLSSRYDIFGIPLVDAGADFKIPLKFGDSAELESSIVEFRRSSFDVSHNIYCSGDLAIAGRETRVWTGRDRTDPSRVHAVPIPDDVAARFKTA